jgi:hypothetical protein
MAIARVYIAGALNADAIGYIKNLRRMIKHAVLVRKAGFAVFVPGLDFLMLMMSDTINYNFVFYNSWSWIKVSDAIYVVPKSRKSKGTKREIELAKKMGIPVFYKLKDMEEYFVVKSAKNIKKKKILKKDK